MVRCLCLRGGGRWRSCFMILFYLLAVIVVENIIHTVRSMRRVYDGNLTWVEADTDDKKALTTSTTLTVSSTTTSVRPTMSQSLSINRVVRQFSAIPSMSEEDRFYRRRPQPVNLYRYRVVLEPNRLCPPNTRIVVLVHSHHPHTDRRSAIRSTWGEAIRTGRWPNESRNRSCTGLRMAFVLGVHRDPGLNDLIAEESARYDDIVQGDFADSYQNMTLKSLLDLKIVDERCSAVRYLLKTDDDMVVNLPYLLHLLDNVHANLSRSIMGPLNVGSRVYRHGKWKLTRSEFPFDHFPPYESGSAYVITGDLIHELFVTAEYVPHIFIDDVYVTGILGRILGVNHVRQPGFAFWTSKPPTACELIQNRVVAGTKMTPSNLLALWKQLKVKLQCSDVQPAKSSGRRVMTSPPPTVKVK